MSREKQIEEMAKELCGMDRECKDCNMDSICISQNCASIFYKLGYRKQEEGEWAKTQFVARTAFYTVKEFPCNKCGEIFEVAKGNELMHYCPNCGAKMKGGAE